MHFGIGGNTALGEVGNSRVRKVDIVAGSEKVIVRLGGCFKVPKSIPCALPSNKHHFAYNKKTAGITGSTGSLVYFPEPS
ncbi:hypothetical protein [Pseudomonas tolaasii]|uniref:hypothetical protein n=1 Tax=Pseudomonas tolaasii TaxID=29442 RepID=UPI0015A3F5D8|nr:hypothetical protein [Pseudomonas tolaasii]